MFFGLALEISRTLRSACLPPTVTFDLEGFSANRTNALLYDVDRSPIEFTATLRRTESVLFVVLCSIHAPAVGTDKLLILVGKFMKAGVFVGRQQLKILQSVIRLVEVDVMNLIAVGNLAVEMNASHSFSFA